MLKIEKFGSMKNFFSLFCEKFNVNVREKIV